MGLIRCPASFQQLMEKLMDKIKNLIVYIDNLLVHSQTYERHLQSLEPVMQRLKENNMKINLSKCFCRNTEVNYLGFRLTPTDKKPCKDKLKPLETANIPQTKEKIKCFAGLCIFLHSHQGFCQNVRTFKQSHQKRC